MRRAGLLAVLGFVGLTALAGGLVMAFGSWLGPERLGLPAQLVMPESMLAGSPFNSYFLPGLLLALVVGGTHLAAFILVAGNRRWAAMAAATAGYSILIWIFVQMVIIPFTVLQAVYFAAGLAELGLLLLSLGLIGHTSATSPEPQARAVPAAGPPFKRLRTR